MHGRSLASLIMVAATLGGVGCGRDAVEVLPAETASVEFAVEGMTCDGCAAAIGRSLQRTPGVVAHTVSFAEARARVTFDPTRTSPAALAAAIENAGYRVVEGESDGAGGDDPPAV